MKNKNIILFLNTVSKTVVDGIRAYQENSGQVFRIFVLRDNKFKSLDDKLEEYGVDVVLTCDLRKPIKIEKALLPYKDELAVVTCRGESSLHSLAKVIPHVPYVRTPTVQSILWATDKIMMRELLRMHDKKISPRSTVVSDSSLLSIQKIKDKVGFPLVIKPAGLAQSLLVTICFHEEELEKNLKKVYRKIQRVYKENKRKQIPQILVEQLMEGEMYSVDGFVSGRGRVSLCPLVHVKTGRSIGFDDFFGYQRIVPTTLSKVSVEAAEHVARQAVHALKLRNTSVHIELIHTDSGWKVIELAPRLGGFRHKLYSLSFGIDMSMNDILIRMPKPIIIPKKIKAFSVALQFYAKKEGQLTKLSGLKKVQKLTSFIEVKQFKQIGEKCLYAKHGGKPVCNIMLSHKNRSDLLADIRRVEQIVVIETKR